MDRPEPSSRLIKALAVLAQIFSRDVDSDVAETYAHDLVEYPEPMVLAALARCRKELRTFPTIADIIARIDDGRPGPEEAWAMIPKDEESSIVWTEEMQGAFSVARELLREDLQAARMAFRETYIRLLTEARAQNRGARWSVSLGTNLLGRGEALRIAVERGRLSQQQAQELLPDFSVAPSFGEKKQLPTPPKRSDLTQLSSVMDRILEHAPEDVRKRERIRQTLGPSTQSDLTLGTKETEELKRQQLEKFKKESSA